MSCAMIARRRFITGLAAAAAGLTRGPQADAAEGPLETTTIRLNKNPGICIAPLYFAEELLRTEGFADIRYVEIPTAANEEAVATGKVDFAPIYGPLLIPKIEAGVPVTVLAGIMVGCFELFGNAGVRGIADLKGKTVGVQDWGSTEHVLVTLMAAHVGLDPLRLGSPPLTSDQVGLVVTAVLLQPISAGEPSRQLVQGYEELLRERPNAPKPAKSWSGDVWAFASWARGNLPGFDPHQPKVSFLPSVTLSAHH